ncbi:MAG: response regulator [Nitrospirae bacterium]|nr:response regulator [Nitrospirota bacterium]
MTKQSGIQRALLININSADSRSLEKAFLACCPATEIIKAPGVRQGLDILQQEKVDAVFIDYVLSVTGINFLKEIKQRRIHAPAVVIVEKGKELEAAEAIKEGAYDYLIRDAGYKDSLPGVLERIRSTSKMIRETEEEQERRELLFNQIYKSQKWWQHIIDAIKDYVFVIDNNYRILRTNKAFAGLFGKEPADIIMKPYYELFGLHEPHEWCVVSKEKEKVCPGSVERKLSGIVYLISCFPISYDQHDAVVYTMKDVTETRRLKDQIYHLDKLSSLGTLTSGVAHEINNPLTGIIGYTEMLLMDDRDETTKKYLRNVYDSAIRCKKIVENMLTFSRQTTAQKSPENVNEIIDKTIELHEYWLKSTNIEIIRNYGVVPYIDVDRQQMQQVALNLLINAEHAISETDKRGRIEFKTVYDKAAKNIVITVSDNGAGIAPEILPRIFDPFFTTKPVNIGTGLGLSIAHGIITEQGGAIEAKSEAGTGTAFIITLPKND